MTGFKINNFRLKLNTSEGGYGFECIFKPGLNIIRGNNSSGKSTLINSIIYSLGMEEILGGKGPKTLPYALKEYVESQEQVKVGIGSSYVYIEIVNYSGDIVTLKRAINSSAKDTKLIEVICGPYLSSPKGSYKTKPTFVHDKGSAQHKESGFFSFLESFIGLNLPNVPSSNGGEVKLYLQTIFSAMLVEQKRGWTDYIASTPYYAIRDVRTKIVEFLLGLDVFENDRERASLIASLTAIQSQWSEEKIKIRLIEEAHSINVSGVKGTADDMFDLDLVQITKEVDETSFVLYEYISNLVRQIESMEEMEDRKKDDVSIELVNSYRVSKDELDQLVYKLDSANAEVRLTKARLADYLSSKNEIEKDLEKNKIAKKLKKFGAEQDLSVALDSCPACHQHIDDSLFLADTLMQPMSIEDNVKYLESQSKMVIKYIAGLEKAVGSLESQSRELSERVVEKRSVCMSLKKNIRAFGSATESDLRVKLQIEGKIERLSRASKEIENTLLYLKKISDEYKHKKARLTEFPKRKLSIADTHKYTLFQNNFRKYAGLFGYKSAPVSDIEINKDTLFPYLSGLELREVNTDIKSDSSASDFVRLIWSYLLSVFATSNNLGGNHVGLLVLDEPGQHSMAVMSVNSLLKNICLMPQLQGIVAASFDESDEIFEDSVAGVDYHLINCGPRLLRPTSS